MITSIYAIPLAVLFIILSVRVITYRRANQLGLGDHGDKSLMKRMRAHANFTEYTPFALVLMIMVELHGPGAIILHVIGGLLLAGRLAHGYGFSASPPKMNLRVGGMALTFASYLVSIGALVYLVMGPV
ncbi:MAPEG family protein [Octadecabacter sp. G9-8]|uniref:MAPEG family protein n=1 Tax=Octadecabacter dasysiphoniae TaxID=2909341 RepID=A0ABS9CUU0_9RHOB|nr:MAPEG family protein [Octadecabacter dasysiphoniae]MCF2870179.1 MAPEG family protein [Octadecabacter dasysiphoniae]